MDELVNITKVGDRYEITPASGWEPVASTVIAAGIARIRGVTPDEIKPTLAAYADPDALDSFLTESNGDNIYIQFSAWEHLVTVDGDLTVTMKPLPGTESVVQGHNSNVDRNNQSHS